MPTMDLGPAGERVARNVATIRDKRGMSLRELSTALGEIGRPILPSGIIKVENGTRRVDVADLVAMSLALGVVPNRLILSGEHEGETMALTAVVATTANDAWRWADGELPFHPGRPRPSSLQELMAFQAENRPHATAGDLPALVVKYRDALQPFLRAARAAMTEGVPVRVLMHAMLIADAIDGDLPGPEDGGDDAR